MNDVDIKKVIRTHRLQANLTMKELADKVGVSEATVSRWESGNIASMKHSQIASLCKALNINPVLLVPGIDPPNFKMKLGDFFLLNKIKSSLLNSNQTEKEKIDHHRKILVAYEMASDDEKLIVDTTLKKYYEEIDRKHEETMDFCSGG